VGLMTDRSDRSHCGHLAGDVFLSTINPTPGVSGSQ